MKNKNRKILKGKQIGFAKKLRKTNDASSHPWTILPKRKSWSKSFTDAARRRRFIMFFKNQPHVQYGWAHAMRMPHLAPVLTRHAPWLDIQGISYRRNRYPDVDFFHK